MTSFGTTCGHFVVAHPDESKFGSRWQVRISGPRMSPSKVTRIYCDASRSAVITAVAAYFQVNAESLVLPPIRPDILIGLDGIVLDPFEFLKQVALEENKSLHLLQKQVSRWVC